MTEPLGRADVAKVARLARLALTDDELDRFTSQLARVLTHAEDLDRLDLSDAPEVAHPYGLTNVLRADELVPSLSQDDVLAGAPDTEDGRFGVPRILGTEP